MLHISPIGLPKNLNRAYCRHKHALFLVLSICLFNLLNNSKEAGDINEEIGQKGYKGIS